MLVDFEKVLVLLKREISAKPSHGRSDLLAAVARLEGECMLEEGLPEKALRLYGDDLVRPAPRGPSPGLSDGLADDPRGGTTDRRAHARSNHHAVA